MTAAKRRGSNGLHAEHSDRHARELARGFFGLGSSYRYPGL